MERTRSLTKRASSSIRSPVEETNHPIPPIPSVSSSAEQQDSNGTHDHTEHIEEEKERYTQQPKSPLLTSHRISTESLDNVNLDEDGMPAELTPPKGSV